ncbi:MAG: divalent metal cation transporter [Chloroflexota bacterium]|nr:MAG: divalent metal cation transporter [Chloroflexota bacterium]
MSKPHRRSHRLWLYLAVMGPGIIAASAGNDAGGIATYSSAGAAFGNSMLWLILVLMFILIVVQEMAARMGAVTHRGLSDLIRETFGVRWTTFAMLVLLVANGNIVVAEFAGIAASTELLGISRYISVPIMAAIAWLIVVKGSYVVAERIFLLFSAAFLAYPIAAYLAHPDWGEVLHATIVPRIQGNTAFLVMAITVVGTTVSPYMQFFLQSSVVDKGIGVEEYRYERADVVSGVIFSILIAFFIMLSTAATLYPRGITVDTAAQAAQALVPFAGPYAEVLFAVGLFGASMLAASVLPLSTAYAVSEAFGWERGVTRSFGEAKEFTALYTGLIVIGALVVLVPGLSLIGIMLTSQFLNGILLPVILVFMLLLVNRRSLMGRYVNGPIYNLIAWATVVLVTLAIGVLLVMQIISML